MGIARRVAERLSRGRVFRRTFPKHLGGAQFYASPESGLRYLRPNLEAIDPILLGLAAELIKPGSVIWDIGANLGLFSFAAAGLAGSKGRVFAVEPDTYLVGLLRRSSRLQNNHAAPVEVIPCAVSDGLSLATFNIAKRARASNFLVGYGHSQTGGVRESQRVLTITLDWLGTQIPAPDLIKIDAEGADFLVLKGASELIRNQRPILIFEGGKEIAQESADLLLPLGYTLFDGDLPPEQRKPLTQAAFCTLAVPAK
jgi:FkbM family methyltransferase